MRLMNTVGTGRKQARNVRRPRQLRSLALIPLLLLASCGQSETDRATDEAANAANPTGKVAGR